MNVGQMLCHLIDSFNASMGARAVSPIDTIFSRTLMKWGALYLPVRWPQGTPTRPEVEAGLGGTRPKDFASDRAALAASIERFCDPTRSFTKEHHPFFGAMTTRQWLRWGYLHADHHLRQFGA
jgi:hypothetical protein